MSLVLPYEIVVTYQLSYLFCCSHGSKFLFVSIETSEVFPFPTRPKQNDFCISWILFPNSESIYNSEHVWWSIIGLLMHLDMFYFMFEAFMFYSISLFLKCFRNLCQTFPFLCLPKQRKFWSLSAVESWTLLEEEKVEKLSKMLKILSLSVHMCVCVCVF